MSVPYHKASPFQIRSMFHHFFPLDKYEPFEGGGDAKIAGHFTPYFQEPVALSVPLADLADQFVKSVPSREFSTAELQGYLLLYKWDPQAAMEMVEEWVVKTREEKQELEAARRKAKRKPATSPPAPVVLAGLASVPSTPGKVDGKVTPDSTTITTDG